MVDIKQLRKSAMKKLRPSRVRPKRTRYKRVYISDTPYIFTLHELRQAKERVYKKKFTKRKRI